MTAPFLLDIRAVQTTATRDYFARSWSSRPSNLDLSWFIEDATKALSAAFWELDAFAQSIAHPAHGHLNAEELNRTAESLKSSTESALSYGDSVLQAVDSTQMPATSTLRSWIAKCRQAFQGAFEHWVPFQLPSREQLREWEAAGDLISLSECLAEARHGASR